MTDDEDGWSDVVVELLLDGGRESAAALVREQVTAGVDRGRLLVELESLQPLLLGEEHAEDALQELVDRLAGRCAATARI